ncbi:response regulator transcription factor [Paenibacillus contaminans]|uniref:DNA-binding response regulator n=1 Tax=Paenibacillus contaminans TaxID=450362 RepID=A0A329MUL2_9BACL|nr:response regulator [Paenibacillus contaminans]RAV23094.1 hypothetical protein DQG23_02555 [Paenibacillus contaminans]
MLRMLIVDDEPVIVDSMFHLFRESVHLELEIYRAYDAEEAIEYVQTNRIDIVLSDIRMPGMNGIELQKIILEHWPQCKIIFLTGYVDFNYAQQAIRNGGVSDYLLKNEDDDMILQTVERVIGEIEKHSFNEQLIHRRQDELQSALSAAQKEVLLQVVSGHTPAPDILALKFAQFEIPLDPWKPVFLFIGRVDHWAVYEEQDRSVLAYAIQNIIEEHLDSIASSVSFRFDETRFLWMLQPKPHLQEKLLGVSVSGCLEDAQTACRQLLKLPVSFAIGREAEEWQAIEAQFYYLNLLLGQGLNGEEELFIQEQVVKENMPGLDKGTNHITGSRHLRKEISLLEQYLETGNNKDFTEQLQKMMNSDGSRDLVESLEMFHTVSLCLITYANRTGFVHLTASKPDLNKLTQFHAHRSWSDVIAYFIDFAGKLFASRQEDPDHGVQRTVQFIKQYISTRLEQDLTLTTLSALVHHSPTYLSKLFKRAAGVTLFNYITECRMVKAKQLLGETAMKVHEIAAAVGYEATPQFTRIFKKWYGITPQEYREHADALLIAEGNPG